MKTLKINISYNMIIQIVLLPFILLILYSCNDEFLNEEPLSDLNPDIVLTSPSGFENYVVGLYYASRRECEDDFWFHFTNFVGTDIADDAGAEYFTFRNWISYLTPTAEGVNRKWNWAYGDILPQANTIISYANNPALDEIWESEEQKNRIIAEARFFRGYTYNFLANLWGGVPIVDAVLAEARFDFQRATRQEVLEFAKNDLVFASKWLPETAMDGKLVKAAADHLLSEVYISLGENDNAIASASNVIESELYQLMTERFGSQKDEPGDVFSDLFRDNNQNRGSGNLESIFVWQIEEYGEGRGRNQYIRNWGPFLVKISSPDGYPNVPSDTLGRGVGRVRPTPYLLYKIWKEDINNEDIRNSKYNWRRTFYYNNPKSSYYLQPYYFEDFTLREDTMRSCYPYPRKIESWGNPYQGNPSSGRTSLDIYVYRLAETYLLRAEAYLRKGDLVRASNDINVVRKRSNAEPVEPNSVTIDYILDERARELVAEEPRRRTLVRMGKLVERVREYALMESSRESIQDYHEYWPIPQAVIDGNLGLPLKQNPGYN